MSLLETPLTGKIGLVYTVDPLTFIARTVEGAVALFSPAV